jgi:ubiquinone/menaquinone biosynthesis C-methylase UbiE
MPTGSLDRWPEDYERGRPGWPREAVGVAALLPTATVLELGAGTGKLTRLLIAAFDRVIALEPAEPMRRLLEKRCPEAETVAGNAEDIPLAAASVDAVFAAEAFHRFDEGRALAEIVRVLRPGGALVLLWNLPTEPSIAALEQFLAERAPKPGQVDYDPLDLRGAGFSFGDDRLASAGSRFEPLQVARFANLQTVDRDGLLSFFASMGWLADLPDADRLPLLDRARSLLASDEYQRRWETEVHWTRLTEGPAGRDRILDAQRHGQVFDGMAEAYDALRSGYPSALVATAVEIAGLGPESRVVEVGSGTGKLTEELVALGLHVDAVEPGRNMIEVARRRLNDSELVRFHIGRFEDVPLPERSFDAVLSASAFHWVDPQIGWRKAAGLLRPGGTLGLFQPVSVRNESAGDAVAELDAAFRRLAPAQAAERPAARDEATIVAGAEQRRDNVSEVWAWLAHPGFEVAEAERLFGPATLTTVPRVIEQTADELWAVFETTARHERLSPAVRAELRSESERIIDRSGGTLRSTRIVALVTAQRR